MTLPAHGIVAVIELILYLFLLVPTLYNLFHHGIRKHISWVLLALFTLVKITGAGMLIYVTQHPRTASTGVQVATQILYQIALGPLLSATLSFLNPRDQPGSTGSGGRGGRGLLGGGLLSLLQGESLPRVLRLIHTIIIAAVALGVVGGTDRAPTSDGKLGSDYDSGATLLKVSSILLLVALIGITYGLVRYFPSRQQLPEPQRTLLVYIAVALPLLLIRVIYSLLGSFNLSTTKETKTNTWNTFSGNVAAYVLMSMLEQVGVVVIYTVGGFIAKRRENDEVRAVVQAGEAHEMGAERSKYGA